MSLRDYHPLASMVGIGRVDRALFVGTSVKKDTFEADMETIIGGSLRDFSSSLRLRYVQLPEGVSPVVGYIGFSWGYQGRAQ